MSQSEILAQNAKTRLEASDGIAMREQIADTADSDIRFNGGNWGCWRAAFLHDPDMLHRFQKYYKFVAHEDDWIPLVSPHTAPKIIWCIRDKCQHLLTGKDPWMKAADYLRIQAHKFWEEEAKHKKMIKELELEMNNPKYSGKRKL